MQKQSTLAALLIAILFVVFPIHADTIETIVYDEIVSSMISQDDFQHDYIFDGRAGDQILIEMISPIEDEMRLDSYLILQDEQGNDLVSDDDSAGNLNSLIGPYTLPYNGMYTIVATRFQQNNGTSEGQYTLMVRSITFDQLGLGSPAVVTLEQANSYDFLMFVAPEDGIYQINYELLSGDGYADLIVRNVSDIQMSAVAVDQNNRDTFTSVSLTAGQSVTLIMRSYGLHDGEGVFLDTSATLSVTVVRPDVTPLDLTIGQESQIADTLSDPQSVAYYTFFAENGQTISMIGTTEEGDIETYLIMPSGMPNYYGGTFYQQEGMILMPQILTQTGDYVLVVHRSNPLPNNNPNLPIAYRTTLLLVPTPQIQNGIDQEGTLTVEQAIEDNQFIYMGRGGQSITITLETDNDGFGMGFSMETMPYDLPADVNIPFFVNFSGSTSGRITYDVTLPYDNVYIVRVYNNHYDPITDRATYRLSININD